MKNISKFSIFKYRVLSFLLPFWRNGYYPKKLHRLLDERNEISVLNEEFKLLKKGKYKFPEYSNKRRLYFDVSIVMTGVAVTGIPRVVLNILEILLKKQTKDFVVVPVYITEYGLREANRFLKEYYGLGDGCDRFFRTNANDVYFCADLNINICRYGEIFNKLHDDDVKIYFLLYDLLPVSLPYYYASWFVDCYIKLLHFYADYDGVVAISQSVVSEFNEWSKSNGKKLQKDFLVSWTHLGSDFSSHIFSQGIPDKAESVFRAINIRDTCLMVSTLEPRKGYRQSLDAFEKLWEEGNEVNLIIVGRKGWFMDDFIDRLKHHPELYKRLYWLPGISDEYLEKLYETSTGVLMASEGEGFGLAVIECANYGKPLLCRDLPIFKEIAGQYATYFKDDSPQAFSESIKQWLSLIHQSKSPDSSLIKRITWEETADNILKIVMRDS